MGVVKEVIYEINFYGDPLKKHRYHMSNIKKKALTTCGTRSGILIEELQRRDRIASGILQERAASGVLSYPQDASQRRGCMEPAEYPDFSGVPAQAAMLQESSEAPKPKKQFRTIKRIEEIIYDDTAVKMGKLEDEAYDVLNDDGFYDEILPVDFDEDIDNRTDLPIKEFLLYTGALILMVGFSAWILMTFVF